MTSLVLADLKKYVYQNGVDPGGRQEDLPKAMDYRDGWQERVKGFMLSACLDDDDDDVFLHVCMYYEIYKSSR